MKIVKMVKRKETELIAENYCNRHGYDFEMLKSLPFFSMSSFGAYAIPSKVIPDGLMNDLDTQPTSILLAVREKDSFIIEETEHTKPYFNGELDHLL
ncbi:MAG TPA: hypothetical protein GXZ43_01345 [Clostridiaceae bacterium]|nr:hypothetical protein [Clostridiaceae bacterium]